MIDGKELCEEALPSSFSFWCFSLFSGKECTANRFLSFFVLVDSIQEEVELGWERSLAPSPEGRKSVLTNQSQFAESSGQNRVHRSKRTLPAGFSLPLPYLTDLPLENRQSMNQSSLFWFTWQRSLQPIQLMCNSLGPREKEAPSSPSWPFSSCPKVTSWSCNLCVAWDRSIKNEQECIFEQNKTRRVARTRLVLPHEGNKIKWGAEKRQPGEREKKTRDKSAGPIARKDVKKAVKHRGKRKLLTFHLDSPSFFVCPLHRWDDKAYFVATSERCDLGWLGFLTDSARISLFSTCPLLLPPNL